MTLLSDTARTIFKQALADCSVEQAVARYVDRGDQSLKIGGDTFAFSDVRHLRIIAVGKAANTMFQAIWRQLAPPWPGCDMAGVVIAPERPPELPGGFEYFAGGHPSPNEASFAGARAALESLRTVGQAGAEQEGAAADTLCLFLISGGASAMMELPLDTAISLVDTVEFHRALVASGASITEINCVRKHFSAVKGGRLAVAAGDALSRSLLISDVPAGHEDALGSGPTIPDASTVAECHDVLTRYRLPPRFPVAVRRFFESTELAETPKPAQLQAHAHVLLSAEDLARAAAHRAEALGWTAIIDNTCDEWDYREAAKYLLDRLQSLRRQHSRVSLISAGEVIVALPSSGAPLGIGGRNQQFALYASTLLTGTGRVTILSAGSDGIDGNSPAAGAVVDERTTRESADRSSARQALESFDAYPFLVERNAAITTGPSGNNLRDLRILLGE
jgi:glycerate 2-kinase